MNRNRNNNNNNNNNYTPLTHPRRNTNSNNRNTAVLLKQQNRQSLIKQITDFNSYDFDRYLQLNGIQSLQLVLKNFQKIKSTYDKYDFDECVNDMLDTAQK